MKSDEGGGGGGGVLRLLAISAAMLWEGQRSTRVGAQDRPGRIKLGPASTLDMHEYNAEKAMRSDKNPTRQL